MNSDMQSESNKMIDRTNETVIDLDKDDSLSDNVDLNSISHMHVYDEVGNRHAMADIWSEFKTIFVFVRVISLL